MESTHKTWKPVCPSIHIHTNNPIYNLIFIKYTKKINYRLTSYRLTLLIIYLVTMFSILYTEHGSICSAEMTRASCLKGNGEEMGLA